MELQFPFVLDVLIQGSHCDGMVFQSSRSSASCIASRKRRHRGPESLVGDTVAYLSRSEGMVLRITGSVGSGSDLRSENSKILPL